MFLIKNFKLIYTVHMVSEDNSSRVSHGTDSDRGGRRPFGQQDLGVCGRVERGATDGPTRIRPRHYFNAAKKSVRQFESTQPG